MNKTFYFISEKLKVPFSVQNIKKDKNGHWIFEIQYDDKFLKKHKEEDIKKDIQETLDKNIQEYLKKMKGE